MLEKDITPRILKTMRDDDRFFSGLYEIKMARGKTLPKTALAPHQFRALQIASEGSMYFKIPDMGFQNPADAFILKKSDAYLVIWFQLGVREHEVWALHFRDIQDKEGQKIEIGYARERGLLIQI